MNNLKTMPWRRALPQYAASSTRGKTGKLGCALAVLLGGLTLAAQAQTTFKPFQIRAEWPAGVAGTMVLTNNALRVATNGASATDGTGTNWIISPVTPSVGVTPAGITASLTDSSGNPVGVIPIQMNTGNASTSSNLLIKLVFDGTQSSGVSTIGLNFPGGVTNGYFPLVLEVGKIWNGSANAATAGAGSWSDSAQWLGGSPGSADDVVFTDLGEQTNSLLNNSGFLTNSLISSSVSIGSLRFALTNVVGTPKTNYQNIFVNAGQTLTLNGANGFSILRDYAYWSPGAMNISIYGTNGAFVQTNSSSTFSILSDGQANAVLDMSGLGKGSWYVNRFFLSDYLGYPNYQSLVYTNGYTSTTAGAGKPQRFYQTWKLPGTNYLQATYVDPNNYTNSLTRTYALMLGHNEASGGGSGADAEIYMGYSNVFNMDSICVAGSFCLGADLQFLNTGSYAKFRNSDGVSRMSIFATADAGGPTLVAGLGDNTKCGGKNNGVDFSKGIVDMLVDRFYLSLDRSNVMVSGKGISQTSGFAFGAGVVDANTAILGYQSQGIQTNQSYCYASMVVSNTAVFRVNGTLALGYSTCASGSANLEQNGYGKITIASGGTVMASNITVGGVTKVSTGNTIAMTGSANLTVSNGIADATAYGALGTLSFAGNNNSIKLFIDGTRSTALIYVTNFTASGTGNKLVIGGIKNLTYPADVVIVQGAGSASVSASSFDAGVSMPAGLGLSGTLSTSSTNTINLHIINRLPNNLVWRGTPDSTGTADWDFTTTNWVDKATGYLTNYDNPDTVAFDDTPTVATNINLAGALSLTPTAINLTNNALIYTFLNGANEIVGGPAFNKYGTNIVEIDGSTTVSMNVNQGTFQGSGVIGNANIAPGAVMNFTGNLGGSLACAGLATLGGTLTGSLTVQSNGVVTNNGTLSAAISVLSGGFLYNAGTGSMPNIGVGVAGAPQVAAGGTLVNDGAIGQNLGGNVLYVNGTFEDLGDASDNLTLQSVTMGKGSTFIPGGSGIGTTTINSDGEGLYPGAALLVQGSTNIFKINVTGSVNTVLSVNDLSFGASASVRSASGCTLQLINTSGTQFGLGQSFHLFDNVNNSGTVPYNTGTSTNTYPVIIPASPGAGLAWDLSQLWVSGNIGVVSSTGPTLVNSFGGDGTGTNIVGQFSWDASKLGYRLETLVVPTSVGLTPNTNYNWTGVAGSWTNTAITITNVLGPNSVFYRLTFP